MDYRTRAQWGATFDVTTRAKMSLPVGLVFIHHNVMQPTNNPNADMEATEQVDISRFGCPSYKWAIHPSGVIFEGMSDHGSPDTLNHNSDSISIMFMGNFENDNPTPDAMMAGRELMSLLEGFGYLTKDFKLQGHRDVFATACPGANLYPRIKELLIAPPTVSKPIPIPIPIPIPHPKENTMTLEDPTTGGVWHVDETGAVFAYDGAPYAGGTNNAKMNPTKQLCVGIFRYHDAHGESYGLLHDFGPAPVNTGDRFRRFRFPRDGSASVK